MLRVLLLLAFSIAACGERSVTPPPPEPTRPETPAIPTPNPGLQARPGSVAAGCAHSCAITDDGGVACWGANAQGALGVGRVSAEERVTRVPALTGVQQITAGCFFTCALLVDTTVRCWGQNDYGQLGDGTREMRTSPVSPDGLRDVAQIDGGDTHTCAVLRDGTVRCWGNASYGVLGTGTGSAAVTPTVVPGIADATQVSAGERATCVTLRSGEARCWGTNRDGELGSGSAEPSSAPGTPERVSELTTAAAITTASNRGAALLRDGTVRYWGMSPLRDAECPARHIPGPSGVIQSYCPTPQVLPQVAEARTVELGTGISAVLLLDGRVLTWDGYSNRMPTAIDGIEEAVAIGIGSNHACARLRSGVVRCWGSREDHLQISGGAATRPGGPNTMLADVPIP